MNADVLVVGGGPAGTAAAITLARAGRSVVVVDRARFPRDKCCGDGITTAALRRYEELGLRPEAVRSWQVVDDVHLRSPSGRTVDLALPRGRGMYAAVARRTDLDSAFLDVARAAGAHVHDGHAVAGAAAGEGDVSLDVDGMGTLTARYVVAADGMWSPVRKLLGAGHEPGYLGEWHAFRQYFCDVAPPAAAGLWVWFDADLLPGYAWSFPLPGGRANVGFGIRRAAGEPTRTMAQRWPEILGRPHVRDVLGALARPEAPHKAWPIPARVTSTPVAAAGGRVLFAGDAARATDPLTGEGIGQALETGMLAARAILTAGPDRAERAGAHYQQQVARGLGVDHRLAALLSQALSHRKGARTAIRVAGVSGWTRGNFARWLFEDYPRAVLFTPSRWHRGMLAGAGAYRDTTSHPPVAGG